MDKYYLALGRFLDSFASAEDAIFVALNVRSGVTHQTAQAVFSGTRVKTAISFIRRIHEAHHWGLDSRMSEAMEQLAAINTVRDNLLHWGTRPDGEGLRSSNVLRAHTEKAHREIKISPEILDDLHADLGTILKVLSVYTIRVATPDYPRPGDNSGHAMLQSSLVPWRYRRT